MTYETILSCPKCGYEQRLVAEEVVVERDRYRAALRRIAGAESGRWGSIAFEALRPLPDRGQ